MIIKYLSFLIGLTWSYSLITTQSIFSKKAGLIFKLFITTKPSLNLLSIKFLITYRAFTNSCPHQGQRNNWSYNTSQDRFVCSAHGNSYPTDCETNGTAGGALSCYTATYNNGVLTVVK